MRQLDLREEQTCGLEVFCIITTTKIVIKVKLKLEATNGELAITGSIDDLPIANAAFAYLTANVTVRVSVALLVDNLCFGVAASFDTSWQGC